MSLLQAKHTWESVLVEIVRGLENGTLTLEARNEPAGLDGKPINSAVRPFEAKIRVFNSRDNSHSRVVYIEPWGEDYTLRPGEELEVIAAGESSAPWFHIVEFSKATAVYIEGDCKDFAVYQDGQRIECGHNRGV